MKRGELHSTDHHVIRLVKNRQVIRDDAGKVLGIFPEALELRDGEEYLSVNWCEHFGDPINHTVLSSCINSVKKHLTVKSKSLFVLGNIGEIHASHTIHSGRTNLKIRYWPDLREPSHNPSHSAISNLDQNPATLSKLISEAFTSFYDSSCNQILI